MSTSGDVCVVKGRGPAPVAGAAPTAGPAPPPVLPAEDVEAKTESRESDMTRAWVVVADLFCNTCNKKLNSEKNNVRTVRLCKKMDVFKNSTGAFSGAHKEGNGMLVHGTIFTYSIKVCMSFHMSTEESWETQLLLQTIMQVLSTLTKQEQRWS